MKLDDSLGRVQAKSAVGDTPLSNPHPPSRSSPAMDLAGDSQARTHHATVPCVAISDRVSSPTGSVAGVGSVDDGLSMVNPDVGSLTKGSPLGGPADESGSRHPEASPSGPPQASICRRNDADELAGSVAPSIDPPTSTTRAAHNPLSLPIASMISSMSSSTISPSPAVEPAEAYEEAHVHSVYDAIADHFSSTRHSPWPFVSTFLSSLPPGAVGIDVGCGNGKYLDLNPDVILLGSDRSRSLVSLASSRGPTVVADSLSLPYPHARADFAICIAVIHHLSTPQRRQDAVREILRCVKPDHEGGRVLLYVWALEQKNSRRGWDEGSSQDLLVPWVTKANSNPSKQPKEKAKRKQPKTKSKSRATTTTTQPLASETAPQSHPTTTPTPAPPPQTSEPEDRTATIPPVPTTDPPDIPSHQTEPEPEPRPSSQEKGETPPPQEKEKDKTFHRYYHLYRRGELEEDVMAAGGHVVEAGYERDNWWVICCWRE